MSSTSGEDSVSDGEDTAGKKPGKPLVDTQVEDDDDGATGQQGSGSPSRSPAASPLSQILHQEDLFKEEGAGEDNHTAGRGSAYRKAKEGDNTSTDDNSPIVSQAQNASDARPETPSTPDDGPSRRVRVDT